MKRLIALTAIAIAVFAFTAGLNAENTSGLPDKNVDQTAYLAKELPDIVNVPGFELLNVTEHDGVMIVSYNLNSAAATEGSSTTKQAPRVTAFRKLDNVWYAIAHTN